jgi:iron complex outermembrane receptor protein
MEARNKKTICFALSLLTIAISQAVYAEEEPQMLDTVVISASRGENKLKEMPQSTTIITHQEIEQTSVQTVDQLLAEIPGFNIAGAPASQGDPTGGAESAKMRGLTTGGGKVLVLLDGVPIMDPFYMTTQWYRAPLANIDHIEVVRGGSPTWGSMAVAGVVNIISKHAQGNSGEATVGAGSFNTNNEGVSKNFKVSDALSYNITVNRYETGGYNPARSQYQVALPGKGAPNDKDENLQFSVFYKPSSDLSGFLRFGYDIHDENLGYLHNENLQKVPNMSAGLTKLLDNSSDITANFWAQYVNFFKQNGAACYINGTSCLSASSPLATFQADAAKSVDQYMSQFGQQEYREVGASAIYTDRMTGRWSNFQIGGDYRRISATDDETFYATPNNAPTLVNPSLFASTHGTGTQTSDGLFFQTKISLIDPLQLTLAGRYDNWVYSDGIAQLTTAAGATTGGATPGLSKSSLDPTLGAVYELNNKVSMRGSVYRTFRAPGFNNETRSYGSSTSFSVANPALTPETMTGGEIGADYKNGGFTLGASYFYYDITNMIATYKVIVANASQAPASVQALCGTGLANCAGMTGNTSFYTNNQNGIAHGLELIGNWKVKDNVTLNASYTHTDTYLTSEASAITTPLGVQLSGVPKDVATLGVSWKPTDRLRTHAELRYIGSMYVDNTSGAIVANPSAWLSQGSNTVYNASAIYVLDKSMDLVGSVINLFNHQYSENAYTYNSPQSATLSSPLTVNLALKVRF